MEEALREVGVVNLVVRGPVPGVGVTGTFRHRAASRLGVHPGGFSYSLLFILGRQPSKRAVVTPLVEGNPRVH